MTGDGSPDLAVGAPQSDLNGKADSGSVWIINGRLPPATGCRGRRSTRRALDPYRPAERRAGLSHRRGRGDGLGSSIASVGDQNGEAVPISRSEHRRRLRPAARRGRGRGHGRPGGIRDEHPAAALQRIAGPSAGAGLGASLARAGDIDGDGRTDLLAGAPGEAAYGGRRLLPRAARRARPRTSRRAHSSRASLRRGPAPRPAVPSRPPGQRARRRAPARTTAAAARTASPGAAGPRPHPRPRPLPPRRLRRRPRQAAPRRSPSRRSSARSRSRSRSTGSSRASASR